MATYKVTWDIEIDADSPREAAEQALKFQRDPNSTATVFSVFDEEGNQTQIDLLEQPLKTETNTRAMEKKVLRAAHKSLKRRNLSADFEHGQWWITHRPTGAQWSVVDAEGGASVDGFDFEQVSYGEDE